MREICEKLDIKPGLIINAVRTAATGQSAGPGLFEIIVALGKEKTVSRIRKAADIQGQNISLEASGGIHMEDLEKYAPHVAVISMGALTYAAPLVGFKMEFQK